MAEPEESTEKEVNNIYNKIMCIKLHLYQLHLYPQVESMFKACAPLGRLSVTEVQIVENLRGWERDRGREGGGKRREAEG